MSNVLEQIDRINGEVSAQKALISQIASALEGKAGGGINFATGIDYVATPGKTSTVTGLGFRPKYVLMVRNGNGSKYINCVYIMENVYGAAYLNDTTVIWQHNAGMTATLNDDGFTVRLTNSATYCQFYYSLTWYAIG